MLSNLFSVLCVPLLLSTLASAAVDLNSVGALTPLSSKSKICNVLDYGAKADNKTDLGPAISSAFSKCAVNGGATIYIPPGSYSLATGVTLNKGSGYAIQIDGLITLTTDGAFNGNAIVIERTSDVEVFSSNALGAINGQGYLTRKSGSGQNARLLRIISSTNVSVHDLILVDSPTFHLVFNDISNLEAYHITIRGPDMGGTDGIDLICDDNCYLHHIEVTNRDECISVKSPSQNVLIEEVYCNQSGGMSIGSLTANDVAAGAEAAVSNITMRNIYIYQCTEMLMIKTFPGGSGAVGYVKDSLFENFWAYDTTYALDIDQYWESHTTPDTGAVALSGLTFNNWTGSVDNGMARGPIVIRGSDIVPIKDITLTNFDMWTVQRNEIENVCKNVYGHGYCAASSTASSLKTFTTTQTTTVPPAAYTAPTKPAWGVAGYGTTDPIPVYTPAVFWSPVSSGVLASATHKAVATASSVATGSQKTTKPAVATSKASAQVLKPTSTSVSKVSPVKASISNLAVNAKSSAPATHAIASTLSTVAKAVIPSSTSSAAVATVVQYGQCGGVSHTGSTVCAKGFTCEVENEYYSQCI